jgi:hypothetical protein
MRPIIVFAVVAANLLFSSRLRAQSNPITDSSFEMWAAGQPEGWTVDPSSVFQTADAHSGLWAAGGKVLSSKSGAPFVQSYVPIRYVLASFEGYYKFTSVGGDEIMFFAMITANGTPAAQAIFVDSSSTSEYKHFIAPFFFSNEELPDSATIIIELENPNGALHPGTTFVVDDISLAGTAIDPFVSVHPTAPASQFSSVQNYPNPFSQSTTISFTSESGYAEISVVNLLGEEVARIFSGELAAGNHTFTWNAGENLPGMYECVIRQGEAMQRIPIELVR